MKKEELKKVLLENGYNDDYFKNTEIDDMVSLYTLLENNIDDLLLEVSIHESLSGGSYWLQGTYYSKKLGKDIIFSHDVENEFDNLDEFVDYVLKINDKIISFEDKILIKK